MSGLKVTATTALSLVQGTIASYSGGRIVVSTSTSSGMVPVATTGATINTDGASLAVGNHAVIVGTGSVHSTVTATYIALFPSTPNSLTLSGTVVGTEAYGFLLSTTAHGDVPVMTSSTTTGSYVVGSSATVSGVGSGGVAMLASSVSSDGTAASSAATHVLTGGYLGTPWGTTSVSASQAAPHLNYTITDPHNGNAMSAAGIKVMVYASPLLVESSDPLYSLVASTGFATTCSGSRTSYDYGGNVQWVMNPASSALQSAYRSLLSTFQSEGHVDYIYLDDAGPVALNRALSPGNPCDYNPTTWEDNVATMQANAQIPAILNGLNNYGESALSPELAIANHSGMVGGNLEACYASSTTAEQGAWPWTQTEQTEIDVTGEDQIFMCMTENHTTASSAAASRLYTMASFLMTYNPTYSVLFEEYASPSGLDVMPESQLVPTQPLVSQPSSISSLEKGTWTYVREYKACYYAGKLIGACAMVVNADSVSQPTPALSQTYAHTMTLSGNGIIDGGTAGFSGSAPPATMPATSAFIAVP